MAPTDPDYCTVWGISFPRGALTDKERAYLAGLPKEVPTIEWLWQEMDRVWHSLELNSRRTLTGQPVEEFYRHPIWLVNGLFSAADPVSAGHRRAIASYVADLAPTRVADFGGGFGELARQISRAAPWAEVAIIEPFPREVALAYLADSPQVRFVPALEVSRYDVGIAQDVLEHVERPIDLAIDLASFLRPGGSVIFANNFTPIIACHLPHNFHLRHTFRFVMHALGLKYRGRISGAEHAMVFEVPASLHIQAARLAARASAAAVPAVGLAVALRRWSRQGGLTKRRENFESD